MKVTSFFKPALPALLPFLVFAAAGCRQNAPEIPEPEIIVSEPDLTGVEGGSLNIEVQILNPVEGVTLQAESSETWLEVVSVSNTHITASVAGNPDQTERTAELLLTYQGAESVTLTVRQSASEIPFELTPLDSWYDSLTVHVQPRDSQMMYLVMARNAELFDTSNAIADAMAQLQSIADGTGLSMEEVIAALAHTGERDASITGLYPNTPHVVYVFGLDGAGNVLTDAVTCGMSTQPVPDGEQVGCTIGIEISGLTDNSASITFIPSDPSVYYYCEVFDEQGYRDVSQDWNSYIYNYMTSRVISPLTLEETIKIICASGEYTQNAKGLQEQTKYYACAVGVDMNALTITEVAEKEFTTTEYQEADHTIGFSVSNVTSRTAEITATAMDPRAFYYWNVMTAEQYQSLGNDEEQIGGWFLDMMDRRRQEQYGEYADFITLPEYIYSQCTRGSEPDLYEFTSLTGGTEYYAYGFWVDEESGEKTSRTSFSEPFKTPETVESTATVTAELILTDGDDWRELDIMAFGHYKGGAIIGAVLTHSDDAVEWRSNVYEASQLSYSDDELITSLLQSGLYNKERYHLSYPVEWDKEYVILSVAVDADGNTGPLHKLRFTASKDDAVPMEQIPELFPEDFE